MATLDKLRLQAQKITPYTCEFISSNIKDHVLATAGKIVAEGDEDALRQYMEFATDHECVCALSDLSLAAPLSSDGYRIFMFLFVQLCDELGVYIPGDDIKKDGTPPLDSYHLSMLSDIKRKVRAKQLRNVSKMVEMR